MKMLLYTYLWMLLILTSFARAEIAVCTWNMHEFPKVDENDKKFQDEGEKLEAAGMKIKEVLLSENQIKDGSQYIVFLQELRDAMACSNLLDIIGIDNLTISGISCYDGFNSHLQTAILSSLTCLTSSWNQSKEQSISRFNYAVFEEQEDCYIACFCLHLKSNVLKNTRNKDLFIEKQRIVYKRESSAKQILNKVKEIREALSPKELKVIVAGDFNTDEDGAIDYYFSEGTIRSFYAAHYRTCFRGVKKNKRITYNGGSYKSTIDHILYKGFSSIGTANIFDGKPVSDHNIVTIRIQ